MRDFRHQKSSENTDDSVRHRRIVGIISLVIVVLLFLAATAFVWQYFSRFTSYDADQFKAYIDSFGWKGRFVLLGLQVLQILVALIPGELVEIGAGYAFGAIEGTLLCMAGVAIASSLIFILVKRWGIRLVSMFVEPQKIDELRFINNEKKLKRTIFLLFFIPSTPKDLFTYFAGLTRITLPEFLAISMLARIPSLVSSTIGGNIIGESNYVGAIILFSITGAVSLGGMWIYSLILKKHQKHVKIQNKDE